MQDLPLAVGTIVGSALLCGLLLGVRRIFSGQAMKDVLGISATFVILAGFGFLMIVGEHALG